MRRTPGIVLVIVEIEVVWKPLEKDRRPFALTLAVRRGGERWAREHGAPLLQARRTHNHLERSNRGS